MRKGSKVYVEGSIRTREYEKDGITRRMTEVIARDVVLLDGARIGYEESPPTAPAHERPQARRTALAPQTPGQRARQAAMAQEEFNDEIPF